MAGESGQQEGPEQQLQGSGLICQNCGVTVAPGYPKCPKCHGAMPHVTSPLARHGTATAGGTSAVPGSGGFWIALLTIAIVGAVIFFMMRGDEGESNPERSSAVARDAGGEDEMDATVEGVVEDVSLDDGDAGAPLTPDEALGSLEQALADQRLYSGVEANADDETAVRIESAHCEDAGLRAAVEATADDLVSAGFVRVQCYSRHGTRLFETDL